MPLKSKLEKLTEGQAQCREVWTWLRNFPEYQQDFAMLEKTDEYKQYKAGKKSLLGKNLFGLREKWYFFPLVDPKEDFNGYLVEALHLMGEDPTINPLNVVDGSDWLPFLERTKDGIVDWKGNKHKLGDLPKLPERMTITFDPRIPIETLKAEFQRQARRIQALYQIKCKRVRFDRFKTVYATNIGKKLGWTNAQIRKQLKPEIGRNCRGGGQAESWRRRVQRAIKKNATK